MGTNYYIKTGRKVKKVCNLGHEHLEDEELHIGKNSYGWMFTLQIFPEIGINELKDWTPILKSGKIKNEYGEEISYEEMRSIILKKGRHEPFVKLSPSERKNILTKMNSGKIMNYKILMDPRSLYLRVSDNPRGKQGNYCLESREFC